MRSMDTTVAAKLKSSLDMMFDIKSEMDLKQLTIDQMRKQIGELRSDVSDQATQIRSVG